MRSIQSHLFIIACVVFTVASQLIMRWRVGEAGTLPDLWPERLQFIAGLLSNPWIWLSICFTFVAGVSWMLALTRFDISYAFPFTGMNFPLILLAGGLLFGESLTAARCIGTAVVLLGLVIVVRG